MIFHYFKIAFRNILKYKTQSVISMIGLAVGFTCFALSNLWIHYETTYDNYHDGADRMYILYRTSIMEQHGYSTGMAYPASTILKNDFPEVEEVCAYSKWTNKTKIKTNEHTAIETYKIQADSCFMKMFNISIVSGNVDFMYSDDKVALTEETAIQLFGSTDVLGKEIINENDEKATICAILKALHHSNLSFGFWGEGAHFRRWQTDWSNGGFKTIVKLRKGTDPIAFQKKLSAYDKKVDPRDIECIFAKTLLMPLSKYHYSPVNENKSIKFYYLILFSIAGGLVILCSLFNYLSLFISRTRMRRREIELRKVCGSSIGGLFALLSIEYLYIILLSGLIGMALVELVLPTFQTMSGVSGNIYGESLLYFLGILFLSLLLLVPFIIGQSRFSKSGNRHLLRKVSIILQLAVSLLFLFCMIIIMKQIYFLSNTDLGWERKDIATISNLYPDNDFDAIADKIRQFSCTEEVVTGHCSLLPRTTTLSAYYDDWDGKEEDVKDANPLFLWESEKILPFYNIKLLKGEIPKETERDRVMINETAAKLFGMNDPVGKKLYQRNRATTIVGLIKDFYTTPPTIPAQPCIFISGPVSISGFYFGKGQILIKYHDGKWKELKSRVDSVLTHEYPEVKYKLDNTEDLYAEYLKSENILMKLLSFVAVVCMLIAAFGIFSLVTLSCEQRRKEIAVRKVNGAAIKDILLMFVKEYILLLIIASVIAFPAGYVLMKRWLESYIEQTAINTWIYFAIFACITIVILICISWRVWQAARQNPAEVIKE
nr:ABC transporter permease [Bacteroides intestinalis]